MYKKLPHIIYRMSTIALALFILPGLFFMHSEMAIAGLKHVQLADIIWLQQILGYASPLAIITILIPKIPSRLKERAYAGLSFIYIGAFWAHLSLMHPIHEIIMPLIVFAILMVSYYCRHIIIRK